MFQPYCQGINYRFYLLSIKNAIFINYSLHVCWPYDALKANNFDIILNRNKHFTYNSPYLCISNVLLCIHMNIRVVISNHNNRFNGFITHYSVIVNAYSHSKLCSRPSVRHFLWQVLNLFTGYGFVFVCGASVTRAHRFACSNC